MLNRRWKSILCLGLLSMILILSGCGNNNSDGGKGKQKTVNLNFPTAATTGTIYPLGSAMANLWGNEVDGLRVNTQASNGGVNNLNLMKEGEAEISFATAGIIWEAFNGERGFKDRKYDNVRIVAGLYYNPNQFVVRKGADIGSLGDLKGKRFAPGSVGSTPEVESSIILPAYGIAYPDDIKENFVGFTEAIDLMRNKQIDGALIQAGLPTAAVTEMISTADGELIGIEPEIRKQLMDEYPWYSEMTIPTGTYEKQEKDIDTLAIKMMLIADASVDDDIIYEMTKSFWDNLDQLESTHAIVKQMELENATTDLAGIPLHEGAKKYYEEKGLTIE
ncbi:TAXI family TRAP transporter solute-binding subunit [Lederbergia lenta]|uniref:TRAP transporter solute receptor, TAXI family n=1 Tax=Lederbergia lenta TaxID=1467 RepID=A0A2X4YYE8_LEDLE|nr:TAXI family TRAP transporter solute-binding subunit [Lederbergia lenta]MCM3113205.1 TAXI family TRAP transporter solute-binding subunit [Lederbergia lenta]MEC2326007.1 TAXI family TRAP transporter solute-binding subunit [Lederbergia lenta]SQI53374.1 TRAP transporter solute receptor, TAXI family [Lederbergia lenta]